MSFRWIEAESRLDGTPRSESEYDTEGRLIRKQRPMARMNSNTLRSGRQQRTFNSEGTPVRVRTLARDEWNNIILEEWDEGADETINYRYQALYGPLTRTVFYSLNSQLLELTRLRGPDVVNNEFCDDSFCQESVTSELDDNAGGRTSYTFPTALMTTISRFYPDAEGRIASVVGTANRCFNHLQKTEAIGAESSVMTTASVRPIGSTNTCSMRTSILDSTSFG